MQLLREYIRCLLTESVELDDRLINPNYPAEEVKAAYTQAGLTPEDISTLNQHFELDSDGYPQMTRDAAKSFGGDWGKIKPIDDIKYKLMGALKPLEQKGWRSEYYKRQRESFPDISSAEFDSIERLKEAVMVGGQSALSVANDPILKKLGYTDYVQRLVKLSGDWISFFKQFPEVFDLKVTRRDKHIEAFKSMGAIPHYEKLQVDYDVIRELNDKLIIETPWPVEGNITLPDAVFASGPDRFARLLLGSFQQQLIDMVVPWENGAGIEVGKKTWLPEGVAKITKWYNS